MWTHNFRGRTLVLAVTACSCQAFLLLGYDQGVMSGIVGADNRFGRDFNYPDADLQGDIVALYDIGCIIGSILVFMIGERFGRRKMLMAGGGIMVIGSIILATSTTVAQLIVGRIVTGLGNGMNSSTAPVYQSECSPANVRGTLLTLQGTMTILGLCIAYWLDYGTSFTDLSLQWRFPLAFQAVFAIFLILQVIGLPETPRWLMQNDRHEEAREVVAAINDLPSDDAQVIQSLVDIESAIREDHQGGPLKFKEFFAHGSLQNWRRMLIIIAIEIMQQFTGSNMINYYAPTVYQNAMNMSRNMSMILGGCTSLAYLVGSGIPLFLMDRFGRRVLLMVSAAGLCLCFVMTAILLSLQKLQAAYGATAFIFLFQIFYGLGMLPVPWFYPSEISTTRLRSKSAAIASAVNWLSVFVVVKITPIAIQNISWRVFIIFAALNFLWIPIVYFFFPETKGLELEDINLLFVKGGITGGVFSSRGRTVVPHQHAQEAELNAKQESTMIEDIHDTTT
ncbi:general substrate transporter [Aspergillus ambiguus]|uniref:sugar porter family MFS transporter n=1 Tax=Aspergillus ambiguus TaxID=176160 RepID=UPI003CCD7B49